MGLSTIALSSGVAANAIESGSPLTAESEDVAVDGTQIVREHNSKNNISTDGASAASRSLSATRASESVGDTVEFNALDNFQPTSYGTIDATLEAKTNSVKIFVQGGVDNNRDVTSGDVDEMAAAFNNTIRPQLENQFGTWNDFDNDGRLTILVYDMPSSIAGYFNPLDYTNNQNSNQRDMVYMSETQRLDDAPRASEFNVTLTQEVSHAINYNLNQGPRTTSWLDEAVANYAEFEVYGDTNSAFSSVYLSDPSSTALNQWDQTFADYGASFLYAMYLSEHYGDLSGTDGFMRDLIKQNQQGTAAVDSTLSDYGYSDRFDDTLRNWTVANAIDDDSTADKYGYSNIDPSVRPSHRITFDGTDQTVSGSIAETTADYITITADAETLNYDVQNTDIIADVDPILLVRSAGNNYILSGANKTPTGDIPTAPNATLAVNDNSTDAQSGNISAGVRQSSLPTIPDIAPDNTVTNATEYEIAIILPNTATNDGAGTNYNLPITEVPEENQFTGEVEPGEDATYAIPVNKYGTPQASSIHEWNNDVFVSAWSTGAGDVQVDLTSKNGNDVTSIRPQSRTGAAEVLGTAPISESDVWRLDISTSTQTTPFSVASRYMEGGLDVDQIYRLPSDLEISTNNQNLQAGSNTTTKPIKFTVNVSAAGSGYVYRPFAEPDASHFDVTIGGKTVSDSKIQVASSTQRQYDLVVFPPSQSSNGQYDLNVSFTDEKFGVSDTATGSAADSVSYSGTGASGSTSVVLVLDESGSMGELSLPQPTKMNETKTAANQFLSQYTDDDRVSIVSFDNDAENRSDMQKFGGNETQVRNSIASISDRTTGGTDIPAGMEAGLKQLKTTPNETSQATIIMTDAKDTGVKSEAIKIANRHNSRDHCVYTVAFGEDAKDQLLTDISNQSSCGGFRDTDTAGTDIGDIYSDLSDETSGLSSINKTKGNVSASSSVTKSVSVGATTGTTVLSVETESGVSPAIEAQSTGSKVQAAGSGSVKVLLYYPNGNQVRLNSSTESGTENPRIEYSDTGDTQTYQINDPRPGEWDYEVKNTKSSSVDFTAETSGSTQTTLTLITDSQRYTNDSVAELSAILTGPTGPVSGATVTATIEAPDGTSEQATFTEDNGSSGYSTDISVPQTGEYSAAVTVSKGNINREKNISWPVVSKSSLLTLSPEDRKNVTRGNQTEILLDIKRPASPSPSQSARKRGQDTQQSSVSAFDSEARELATLPKTKIENADVSDDLKRAALQLKRQSGVDDPTRQTDDSETEQNTDGNTIRAAGGGGGSSKNVYITTSDLSGENGTISAAQVQTNITAVSLSGGETKRASIDISVPSDTEPGIYNGTVTGIISGSKIQSDVSVNVTAAGVQSIQIQIQSTSEDWSAARTDSLKEIYEDKIGDILTNKYFAADSGGS